MATTIQEIKQTLEGLAWFQASEAGIQRAVLNLGEEAIGLLEHLVNRPIEGGGVRTLRLENFLCPGGKLFGVLLNWRVENIQTGVQYGYQYFVWKQGAMSGSKGVVIVRQSGGTIGGLYCLKGFSFAVGDETFDSVGGFVEVEDTAVEVLMAQRGFFREITQETGIAEESISVLYDLGSVYPDRGMTPNHPRIWAAEVGADIAPRDGNDDPWEMDSSIFFVPYAKLWGPSGFIAQNDDAFFLAIVCRLLAIGIIRQPAM